MGDSADELLKGGYDGRQGSINAIMNNINAIALQLDNSGLLKKTACRFMGGYFKPDGEFYRDTKYLPRINKDGFKVVEHYLDLSTDPNSVLSNKSEREIKSSCFILATELLIDLLRFHKKYELDPDAVPTIVISVAEAMFSGQKRSLGGQTAKAINQIIKQVENIITEQKSKTGGILNLNNKN
jgi:hypothetical protein